MALQFDGATQYGNVATPLLSGAAAFTICLWWRPTSLAGSVQTLLTSYTLGGNNWQVNFEESANAVSFQTTGHGGSDPATNSATAAFTTTDMAHGKRVLYRYDGTTWVVWTGSRTQGVVKKTISASIAFTLPTVVSGTFACVDQSLSYFADGALAEVAAWGYALTDEDAELVLRGVAPDQIGTPVVYWPLRQHNNAIAADYTALPSVSGANSLELNNSPIGELHPKVVGLDWLQNPYAAWVLEIQAPNGTIYAATSDLSHPVDVDVLGVVYPQRIVDAESVVVSKSIESGIATPGTTTVVLQNDRHVSPDNLSGLVLWLEADKIRTAADGAAVATWPDVSGCGRNAVAYGGGATGPAFELDGLNGLPTLKFNATVDSLALGSSSTLPTDSGDSAYTVVTVFTRADSGTGTKNVLSGVGKSWRIATSGGNVIAVVGGATTLTLGAVHATLDTPHIVSYIRNGTDAFARLDGGTVYTGTIGSTAYHPGTRLVIGTSATPDANIDGRIPVVLVYNRVLGMDELTRLENYLASKYGCSQVAHGTITRNTEMRAVTCILRRYERTSHELVTELVGTIADVDWSMPGQVALTVVGASLDKLNERIPKALVTVDEFPTATDLLAPVPVGFGEFWVAAPYVAFDETSSPGSQDYLVSHLEDADSLDMRIRVESVKTDVNLTVAGLETLTSWYTVGGTTPTKHSTTVLQLSANFEKFYEAGMPLKIVVSGVDYYTHVVSYDAATWRVTVADAVIASNPSAVYTLAGAYIVQTAEHAVGTSDILSIRLVGTEAGGGVVVFAKNHDVSNPAVVIKEILRNTVWGLGETVDETTFDLAATDLTDASVSLDTACNYALASDRQQRVARDVLPELLGLRGMWLDKSETNAWELNVDKAPLFSQLRTFGLGDGFYNNIARLVSHIRTPLTQAVKMLKLRFRKKGRTRSSEGVMSYLAATDYELQVNCGVLSVGSTRVEANPWLQRVAHAARVVYYRATRLRGEDESVAILCGFEGRNVTLNEVVRLIVPTSQIDGDYRVTGYDRSLHATTLRTVGYDAAMFTYDSGAITFDANSGANTLTDETGTDNNSTTPTFGPNLITNAGFGQTTGAYTPGAVVADSTFLAFGNNGWRITETEVGVTSISSVTVVDSPAWIGGRYLSMVIAATTGVPQIYTLTPVEVAKAYFASIYVGKSGVSNPQDVRGWYVFIQYYTALGVQVGADYEPVVRTSGELTGGGEAYRWFCNFRPPATAAYVLFAIRFNVTGTYRLAAGGINRVDGWGFLPPPWANTLLGS